MNRRGECYDSETLARYVARELDPVTVRKIDDHIERCLTCAEVVLTAPLPAGEPVGWRAAEPRIEARIQSAVAGHRHSLIQRLLWNPIAGYGVAAMLAVVTVGIPLLRPVPREAPEPLEVLRLDSDRGPISRPSLAGRRTALQFLVPVKEHHRYVAVVDGPGGRRSVGDLGGHDSMGNFLLLYAREWLTSGKHVVIVSETDGQGTPTGESFRYEFAVE